MSSPAWAESDQAVSSSVDQILDHCEALVTQNAPTSLRAEDARDAQASGHSLQEYFEEIGNRLFERGYISMTMQRALVARQPVVVLGPPGNGKTAFVTMALGNILDENGAPSFFTDQMTFETTLSDTHGPIDFKKLMETGRQDRFLDEGIYGHLFKFVG